MIRQIIFRFFKAFVICCFAFYALKYILEFSYWAMDDSYIYFRIAKNWITSGNPFYNITENVLGISSPAWLWLIYSVFRFVGVDIQYIAYLEFILFVLNWYLLSRFFKIQLKHSEFISSIESFFFLVVFSLPFAASLMETNLFFLFFFAFLNFDFSKKPNLAMLAMGFGVLCRFEFLIFAVGYFIFKKRSKQLIKQFLVFLVPIFAYFIWSGVYFGSPIPQNVLAKKKIYTLNSYASLASSFVFRDLIKKESLNPILGMTTSKDIHRSSILQINLVIASAVFLLFLYLKNFFHLNLNLRICFVFSILLLCIFAYNQAYIFPWYWPVILFPFFLTMYTIILQQKKIYYLIALALVGFNLLKNAVNDGAGLLTDNYSLYQFYSYNNRIHFYFQIGNVLSEMDRKEKIPVVMASEIGALGWTYPGKILDSLGLVSPEMLQYYPKLKPGQRFSNSRLLPAAAVFDLKPEVIVSLETFMTDVLQLIKQKKIPYSAISEQPITTDIGGKQRVYVLKREQVP